MTYKDWLTILRDTMQAVLEERSVSLHNSCFLCYVLNGTRIAPELYVHDALVEQFPEFYHMESHIERLKRYIVEVEKDFGESFEDWAMRHTGEEHANLARLAVLTELIEEATD